MVNFTTNMTPLGGNTFSIVLSLNQIELTVTDDSTNSTIKLLTNQGDFIADAETNQEGTQMTTSLFKADVVTGTTISRIAMIGNFKLEITNTVRRRDETDTLTVTIIDDS